MLINCSPSLVCRNGYRLMQIFIAILSASCLNKIKEINPIIDLYIIHAICNNKKHVLHWYGFNFYRICKNIIENNAFIPRKLYYKLAFSVSLDSFFSVGCRITRMWSCSLLSRKIIFSELFTFIQLWRGCEVLGSQIHWKCQLPELAEWAEQYGCPSQGGCTGLVSKYLHIGRTSTVHFM